MIADETLDVEESALKQLNTELPKFNFPHVFLSEMEFFISTSLHTLNKLFAWSESANLNLSDLRDELLRNSDLHNSVLDIIQKKNIL